MARASLAAAGSPVSCSRRARISQFSHPSGSVSVASCSGQQRGHGVAAALLHQALLKGRRGGPRLVRRAPPWPGRARRRGLPRGRLRGWPPTARSPAVARRLREARQAPRRRPRSAPGAGGRGRAGSGGPSSEAPSRRNAAGRTATCQSQSTPAQRAKAVQAAVAAAPTVRSSRSSARTRRIAATITTTTSAMSRSAPTSPSSPKACRYAEWAEWTKVLNGRSRSHQPSNDPAPRPVSGRDSPCCTAASQYW